MNKHEDHAITPLELRKQLLITQGAMYRSGIVASKEKVVSGLGAESLARSAIKQIGLAAFTAWRSRSGLAVTSLPALLPVVISGVSGIFRKTGWKPLARGVLIVGVLASAATFAVKMRQKSRASRGESADPKDDERNYSSR